MASIRSVRANGESVKDRYLAMCQQAPVILEIIDQVKNELKRLREKRHLGKENLNNVPIYSSGSNLTRMVLKGLNSITEV